MFKKLYHRIKYHKQLSMGFKLIGGKKQEFTIINDRAFITNGKDPIVRVDLVTGKVEQYKKPAHPITYIVSKA